MGPRRTCSIGACSESPQKPCPFAIRIGFIGQFFFASSASLCVFARVTSFDELRAKYAKYRKDAGFLIVGALVLAAEALSLRPQIGILSARAFRRRMVCSRNARIYKARQWCAPRVRRYFPRRP